MANRREAGTIRSEDFPCVPPERADLLERLERFGTHVSVVCSILLVDLAPTENCFQVLRNEGAALLSDLLCPTLCASNIRNPRGWWCTAVVPNVRGFVPLLSCHYVDPYPRDYQREHYFASSSAMRMFHHIDTHLIRGKIPAVREKGYFLPTDDNSAALCTGEDMALVWNHGGHVSNQARTHGGVARKFLQVEKRLVYCRATSDRKRRNPGRWVNDLFGVN